MPKGEEYIHVHGARENNLKDVSLSIPKRMITVFTGLSGSGKSSLVFDTIAAESQRQLNETFSSFIRNRLPQYGQPDTDGMENLSPAIIVDQKPIRGNARSTVGTITDINSLLRLLFSRVGKPFVGYSNIFSFNHPEGMCPKCEGIGKITSINEKRLFDKSKSLNQGAILFPNFYPGTAYWKRYTLSGYFDNDKLLEDYTKKEWELLLYQEEIKPENPKPGWWTTAKYEGVIPRFTKRFIDKDNEKEKKLYSEALGRIVTKNLCPVCQGRRLNPTILSCKIDRKNIADFTAMQVTDLLPVVKRIKGVVAKNIVDAVTERLTELDAIGLGYLSLDRETSTLSGGEAQRVKMVRHLGSSLTDMTYILDEPSSGLHPRDVHQLNNLMKSLRDKGNTVLVVEHDPDVINAADQIVDMGPGAGKKGGTIVYQGNLKGLKKANTLTAKYLHKKKNIKSEQRDFTESVHISKANLHNLKNVSIDIPKEVLTVVTGVAGSGKSSLINGMIPELYPETVCIDQRALSGSKRSNPATYTGIADRIRELFANVNHLNSSLFSSNSTGACPACKGLGVIETDLAFMDTVTSVCEVCNGKRFTPETLAYKFNGKNINEVLNLSVDEALAFFKDSFVCDTLKRLKEVGLSYMTLGQPLSSLSGGERQRIKLAAELEQTGKIYILDEPTTGLHLSDVENLIKLLDKLFDNKSTVIIIEHNLEVISKADWIIDMGPGAGRNGGQVIFSGRPAEILISKKSVTGPFLKSYLT